MDREAAFRAKLRQEADTEYLQALYHMAKSLSAQWIVDAIKDELRSRDKA